MASRQAFTVSASCSKRVSIIHAVRFALYVAVGGEIGLVIEDVLSSMSSTACFSTALVWTAPPCTFVKELGPSTRSDVHLPRRSIIIFVILYRHEHVDRLHADCPGLGLGPCRLLDREDLAWCWRYHYSFRLSIVPASGRLHANLQETPPLGDEASCPPKGYVLILVYREVSCNTIRGTDSMRKREKRRNNTGANV